MTVAELRESLLEEYVNGVASLQGINERLAHLIAAVRWECAVLADDYSKESGTGACCADEATFLYGKEVAGQDIANAIRKLGDK